jgi:hypothetical protein
MIKKKVKLDINIGTNYSSYNNDNLIDKQGSKIQQLGIINSNEMRNYYLKSGLLTAVR